MLVSARLRCGPCAFRLSVFVLGLAATVATAQPLDIPAEKGFVRSRTFPMPFSLRPADRANIQQMKLFMRPEQGGDWQLHATASPSQTRLDPQTQLQVGNFEVRVDRDGTFAFAIMTVFNDGKSSPESVDLLRGEQRVIVDTRPPLITLRPLPARRARADGAVIVGAEWKIEDENLARNTVRMEWRWLGATLWTNLFRTTGPEEDGKHEWTIDARQRMEIRLTAADRAGNQATRTIHLGAGVGSTTGGSSGAVDGSDAGPMLNQPNFRLVNDRTIKLQYRVRERPLSGIASIDLYVTRLGNNWEKHNESFKPDDKSETAEVAFTAPEDGTYGFMMIATSHAGIASRPAPRSNETPQIWVEVDTKKPEATLKAVKLSQPTDGRTLVLEWEARDKNLEGLPIIFEYAEVDATSNVGKWQELTTPLPNSGRYVCAAPQLSSGSYLFRVRMNVFDKAGNVTIKEYDKPVSTDVVRPQVDITDVHVQRKDAATPVPPPPDK